jgi:hypothetical protein
MSSELRHDVCRERGDSHHSRGCCDEIWQGQSARQVRGLHKEGQCIKIPADKKSGVIKVDRDGGDELLPMRFKGQKVLMGLSFKKFSTKLILQTQNDANALQKLWLVNPPRLIRKSPTHHHLHPTYNNHFLELLWAVSWPTKFDFGFLTKHKY